MNSSDITAHYISDTLSPQGASVRPLLANALPGIPGIHRELLADGLRATSSWRWPTYAKWLARPDVLQRIDASGHGRPLGRLQNLLCKPLLSSLPATFIEWRYFGIISEAFHGIIGAALFNPRAQFGALAEGGLLLIVAGTLDGPRAHAATRSAAETGSLKEVCWQKLFPPATLEFFGDGCEHLRAAHDGIELVIEMERTNQARIRLSGAGAPHIDVVHAGLERTSILPAPAEDLKRVPGAHWIVHNPSPIARVDGTMAFGSALLEALPQRGQGHDSYPTYASRAFKESSRTGTTARLSQASGYYEHSYGMNPMPLHGWDFIFAPDWANRAGLVMQTYRRSKEICFVEVIWQDGGEQKYTRFSAADCTLDWARAGWHDDLRTHVPHVRRIRGHKHGHTLEVTNAIATQLPFLRRDTPVVKNFFISEEISFTSWTLTDAGGHIISRGEGVPSGGETAYARLSRALPVPLRRPALTTPRSV